MNLPSTLTEALAASQLRVRVLTGSRSQTSREVPYDELYRDSSSLMETPIERIQRAAEEERSRNLRPKPQ